MPRENLGLSMILLAWSATGFTNGHASVGPVEATIAYEALEAEVRVSDVHPDALKLLQTVLDRATRAAVRVSRAPKSRDEALAVLLTIQHSLESHNFLQPADEVNWPITIGDALKPLQISGAQLERELAFPDNARRRERQDMSAPFYFVDCDTGSALFISIGQRLGWDIRLVNVHKHSFVQWKLPVGSIVQWDWTHGAVVQESDSSGRSELSVNLGRRGVYMPSMEAKQSRAYFLGLVGLNARKVQDKMHLLEDAIGEIPNDPITQNNYAWAIATSKELGAKSTLAVSNALAALSAAPRDGNRADTLACALAADGEKSLALAMEDYAIKHSSGQAKAFQENKRKIEANSICE